MAKKLKPITNEKKAPVKVIDVYFDTLVFEEKPITENGIKKIFHEMFVWVKKDPAAFKVGNFLRDKGISHKTFFRWVERFPWVSEMYDEILYTVGDRREAGALQNKLNAAIVMATMPRYDRDWKDLTEWRNDLKMKVAEKGNNQNQVVVIEKFPSPEEVAGELKRQTISSADNPKNMLANK